MTETTAPLPPWRRWPVPASYLTSAGMILCFTSILIQFLAWLFPGSDTGGLLLICGLFVLEAFASHWLMQNLVTAQRQPVFYRGTELAVMFLALKVFAELRGGPEALWNNLMLWPVHFPVNLITGRYLFALAPVLAAWITASTFAGDLFLLGTEEAIYTDDHNQRTPVRTRILRRFLGLGIAVIILAGIPSQNLFATALPVAPASTPAVVIFFVLGLIMVSLTRYINLETNWWQAKLQVPAQIPRRWFAYTALVLFLLVILISLLPTYYGMGLIETLNAVFYLIYRVFMILYGLIMLAITLFVSLFNKQPKIEEVPTQAPTPPPEALPPSPVATFDWTLVKSIILWGGLIVFTIIALRQYISFNQDLSRELRRFRPLRWLMNAWEKLKASFKKANKSVETFIQNSLKRLRRSEPDITRRSEWDFINPRRLSPRQKVFFYYLALVRRAREVGLPRRDDQTPYEYARSLSAALTDDKEQVEAMTAAFVEARYTPHEISSGEATRTESLWETIRQVLKRVKKSRRPEQEKPG
jgi:hypothetical protein